MLASTRSQLLANLESPLKRSICCIAGMFMGGAGAAAQDNPPSSITPEQRKSVSDQRAAEIKVLIEQGIKRQEALEKRNTNVMARWGYAVCIGCGPRPKDYRPVYTHPLRVLAGFVAADDDARAFSTRRGI